MYHNMRATSAFRRDVWYERKTTLTNDIRGSENATDGKTRSSQQPR